MWQPFVMGQRYISIVWQIGCQQQVSGGPLYTPVTYKCPLIDAVRVVYTENNKIINTSIPHPLSPTPSLIRPIPYYLSYHLSYPRYTRRHYTTAHPMCVQCREELPKGLPRPPPPEPEAPRGQLERDILQLLGLAPAANHHDVDDTNDDTNEDDNHPIADDNQNLDDDTHDDTNDDTNRDDTTSR